MTFPDLCSSPPADNAPQGSDTSTAKQGAEKRRKKNSLSFPNPLALLGLSQKRNARSNIKHS